MPAAKLNLKIEQGATFRQKLTWQSDSGTPINLTGYTARMHIRSNVKATDILLELTTENGRISLTQLTGEINLLIDAVVTAGITWNSAVYDLELVNGSEVVRLIQGNITVNPEVTR